MGRIFLCFFCVFLLNKVAVGQPLSAFTNMQNEVIVFDNGMEHKVDFMPPTSMKIGRIAIPYLDNSRSFKVYANGGVKTLNSGFTNSYFVTDNLIAFLNQKSLNVYDKGVIKNLTGVCDQYFIADSVVMFLDSYKGEYKAYYNGQIYSIETYFQDSILSNVKVSDNIVAYDNFANQFRIFFHGRKIAQEDYQVASFDVGRNTVAYVDNDHRFKIFHNGKTTPVDDYEPKSYKAGDDQVAFVSSEGYFKIFYNDSVYTMGFYNPDFQVADYVVAYKDPGGMFNAFYKGAVTELDNYLPSNYTIQYNSLAYVNQANELKLFSEGEVYEVTNADLTAWQLNYDVVMYQIGQGVFKIYYKGTEY